MAKCKVDFSKLNKRIKIEYQLESNDIFNDVSKQNWIFLGEVWAKIEVVAFREKVSFGRLEQKYTHKIIMRDFEMPYHRLRVIYQGKVFDVKYKMHLEVSANFLVMFAEEIL